MIIRMKEVEYSVSKMWEWDCNRMVKMRMVVFYKIFGPLSTGSARST